MGDFSSGILHILLPLFSARGRPPALRHHGCNCALGRSVIVTNPVVRNLVFVGNEVETDLVRTLQFDGLSSQYEVTCHGRGPSCDGGWFLVDVDLNVVSDVVDRRGVRCNEVGLDANP